MIHYLSEKKYDRLVKNYIQLDTAYNFIKQIGVGSYGVAYLLNDPFTSSKYVLKRMKTKHRHSKSIRQKFGQEIEILKKMRHPNVPHLISSGELEDIPFYVMDYVDGKTFEQVIFEEGATFSLDQSLHIVKELLGIVAAFHQKGIVHRDLRIPNILLENGSLKVIDFGLAAYLKEPVNPEELINPKRARNHISDLYFIGHFFLFLLYSNYAPTHKKERSWQEELQLPAEVVRYIEQLLLIQPGFSSAADALRKLPLE